MIDRLLYALSKRPPLEPTQRASLALSSMYSVPDRRNDDSLAGNSAWVKQASWNMLAGAWGIKGVTIAAKRDRARAVLASLRDEGHRAEMGDADGIAWDTARIVNVARRCVHAGFIDDAEGWEWTLTAGALARPAYDGWASFAAAFLRGRAMWAGAPDAAMTRIVEGLLADGSSIWRTTPWEALPTR